jgi:RHH-type rel operon transcriptional repressor/antitoxin RelB
MSVTITLPPEIEARLDQLAAETRRDKNDFVQELLERGIEDIEDYYLGVEALRRVREGKERIWSMAEVKRELGLEY